MPEECYHHFVVYHLQSAELRSVTFVVLYVEQFSAKSQHSYPTKRCITFFVSELLYIAGWHYFTIEVFIHHFGGCMEDCAECHVVH